MMTFLPYSDFRKSAQVLDMKRLNSQRREASYLFRALIEKKANPNTKIGWINHSTTRMWEGYEPALAEYINAILDEWIGRGYKNNLPHIYLDEEVVYPWWLGNEDFHRSHRSKLINKKPEYYLSLFPEDVGFNNGEYLWPLNDGTFKTIVRKNQNQKPKPRKKKWAFEKQNY